LLVVRRGEQRIEHGTVADLPGVLDRGDLLVLNDAKVVRARVVGRRPSGGRLELLFVRALSDDERRWDVIVKGAPRVGERVLLPEARGRWEERRGGGRWLLALEVEGGVSAWLERVGVLPLPPYIRRPGGLEPADEERYQTVVARRPGAIAAPTAGLHFTEALLDALGSQGIPHATVTLQVGPGTFLPLRFDTDGAPRVEPEWYDVSAATAGAVADAKGRGGRVVAVGTTSCRALEAAARSGDGRASSGWADVVIQPGYEFRIVDALLTNFHLPKTPLLALVAAFLGWPLLRAAYEEAIRARYRFYSYGDAMVIL